MKFEVETLLLPADSSFGMIAVYAPGEREHPRLVEARGSVSVANGANLYLDISQELCDDLTRIRLVPERLLRNGISLSNLNLDKAEFQHLRSLEPTSLGIISCKGLRTAQLLQLGELESLEHLNLSHTPIDALDFKWIAQFPNLKTLLLVGLGADDQCLTVIARLRSLCDLHLAYSNITDRGTHAIWKMKKLKSANLSACSIGNKAVEHLGNCSTLRSLDLSGTRISDKGVGTVVSEVLLSGQRLGSLRLRTCNITDTSLVRIASLTGMTSITLYGTNVTTAGISFLKQSLPKCRVFVESDKGGRPEVLPGG